MCGVLTTMDEGPIHITKHGYYTLLVYQREGKETISGGPTPTSRNVSASKAQCNVRWDNIMQGWIAHPWTKRKLDYLKEGTSRKTGLNWAIYFI